jgi:hypothetical protein
MTNFSVPQTVYYMGGEKGTNLCNIYVLPLLDLNKHKFGEGGKFVNSYVSEDNQHVIVESTHPFTTIILHHQNYLTSFESDGHYFGVFKVPEYYKEDVVKFRKGQYSKFTESAKDLIRKKSGLTYKAAGANGKYTTSLELLALDKNPVLKRHWEEMLSNKGSMVVLDDDAELFSIPNENNFYTLNLAEQLVVRT